MTLACCAPKVRATLALSLLFHVKSLLVCHCALLELDSLARGISPGAQSPAPLSLVRTGLRASPFRRFLLSLRTWRSRPVAESVCPELVAARASTFRQKASRRVALAAALFAFSDLPLNCPLWE